MRTAVPQSPAAHWRTGSAVGGFNKAFTSIAEEPCRIARPMTRFSNRAAAARRPELRVRVVPALGCASLHGRPTPANQKRMPDEKCGHALATICKAASSVCRPAEALAPPRRRRTYSCVKGRLRNARRPKSGTSTSCPATMIERRIARVRVKKSNSLSPSHQRSARCR